MRFSIFLFSIILFSGGFILFTPIIETKKIEADIDYLVDLYKSIHQLPELSLQEKETSKKLAEELRKVGFVVTENFGGYGIVGILQNGEGPTILYRTDMDALPMYEKTGLSYASKVEVPYNGGMVGTMHSCGHDIHMTNWVGTARYMSQIRDQWKGTLMFIGQPAEEIGAGARAMLEAGLYEKFGVPDYGIGLHSSPTLPAGTIGLSDGYTMANAESADIKVFGVGAHGASPHMSIDPIVIASMIVMDLQTIASRSVKPVDDVVVTVGAIKGGTKHNIIPDEVTLQLTIRTFKEEVRQLVHQRIEEIAKGVAIAAGLPEDKMPEVVFPATYTPANYNDPDLINSLRISASKVIDSNKIMEAELQMVAEDFSLYGKTSHKVPTVLFWLGTVPDHRIQSGDLPGLHSPFYYPEPTASLETGVAVVSQSMLDLFNQ
ncbi:MAG: amidohydrolase [Bacteroidota bacterium]